MKSTTEHDASKESPDTNAGISTTRDVTVGDVTFCYETCGDRKHPVLLLVAGLGMPMAAWTDELREMFAAKGFFVLSYDQRDSGRSTFFDNAGIPNLFHAWRGDPSHLAYTLEDLADDAIGLLDELEVGRAHLFGVSMGAMVAQLIAIRRPDRVLSLCSALGSTGERRVGVSSLGGVASMVSRSANRRLGTLLSDLRSNRANRRSPDGDGDTAAAPVGVGFGRALKLGGTLRHLAATMAASDRTNQLSRLSIPSLVLHGDHDRMIAPSGGTATARAIPGAVLHWVTGMDHELPSQHWTEIVDAFATNAARASIEQVPKMLVDDSDKSNAPRPTIS